MSYKCPLCSILPYSHSLTKLFERHDILYYYTCPSQAKLYYDVNGIVNHYNGVLSEIPENKEWVWIFDSFGFNFKHASQTKVAIELAKLISCKFSKNLKKIIIINPSIYVIIVKNIVTPFLNENVKNIIEINYNISKPENITL